MFFDRRGQAVVRPAKALPGTRHVLVSAIRDNDHEAPIQALAYVIPKRGLEHDAVLEVDQIIRNAVGVEVGEQVRLQPVRVRRTVWADLLLGRPIYLTMRVQSADTATVERDVCLVDQLTLDLLGIANGDEVVIEGGANNAGTVQQIRLKAVRASGTVVERRDNLHGGTFGARFPSSLDALGVYPDLPWIFLDHKAKVRLGLGFTKLSTVRIRVSRRFQVLKDARELTILLALAAFGVLSISKLDDPERLAVGVTASLVVAAAFFRVRSRLKRPRRS